MTMNIKTLEEEIDNALEINTRVCWEGAELTPSEEFEELRKFVKKLFKDYKEGN